MTTAQDADQDPEPVSEQASNQGGARMLFHVDAWDPTYGSSVESAEASADSTATVTVNVEREAKDWSPVSPSPVTDPGAVLFVDGVRRIEARIWIEQPPLVDTVTGEVLGDADAVMALCASYASGAVCCCPTGKAHLSSLESRRGLFTTAVNAANVTTTAGVYGVNVAPDDPDANLAALLSEALQRKLADLEVIVAANARNDLVAHGVPVDSDLLVIDGPLRGRTHLPRALGYIKSHRTSYLPPPLHAMVSRLEAGQRTPVFLMGTSWDRHSWYLRLPCSPGAPWAGVVRVECAADLPSVEAVALANLSQAVLPRYASSEYKDPRAPQNLVSVSGLERELRRRLGNQALLSRALRIAAVNGAP